jgi:hypothetical protein
MTFEYIRISKHDTHQVRVHLTRGLGTHYAALRCVDCNKHIQWLNHKEALIILQKLTDEYT